MESRLLEVVELRWGREGTIVSAEGPTDTVLRQPAAKLIGRPVGEVLALDARSSGVHFFRLPIGQDGITLRAAIAFAADGGGRAEIVELDALLKGAPPLQISRLSSSLSHELRNPLSSVKMAVQTLQRNAANLSERDQRRLAIANKEIRTMERMLWLFSEYGRETPPHLEAMPLRALVQEAAAVIEPELADRQTTLEIDEPGDLPPVKVDVARARPVLAQLLLNVAMGRPEGGKLPVRLEAHGNGAAMVVHDLEAALPDSEQQTVFEPFGSRLARGAGLSLAALQRVMRGLGGEVLASGGDTPGIVFTLRFPGP